MCFLPLTSWLVNGSYVPFELVRLNLLSQAPSLDHRHVPRSPVRSLPSLHPNIRARKFCGSIDLNCFSLLCSFDRCMPAPIYPMMRILKEYSSEALSTAFVAILLLSERNFNLKSIIPVIHLGLQCHDQLKNKTLLLLHRISVRYQEGYVT